MWEFHEKKDLADLEVRFLLLKTLRIMVCRAQWLIMIY